MEALADWPPSAWAVDVSWLPLMQSFWASDPGLRLSDFLRARLQAGATIYPPEPLRALALTPLPQVRVVILGQDPYHGPGQAQGLAFSVAPGQRVPPSLRNIFKELLRDGWLTAPPLAQQGAGGSLQAWAEAGVLLLNTCLTVEQGMPASHAGKGWELLTDQILVAVASELPCSVYLLWGAMAQSKAGLIRSAAAGRGHEALVLQCNHPSPLSATRGPEPFIGCGHFSQAHTWLTARGASVDWRVLER